MKKKVIEKKSVSLREIRPTPRQKIAVDLLVSGKVNNYAEASRRAGYSKKTARIATQAIMRSKGVQAYLATLDKASREKFGLSLPDKVMKVYFDALESTKLYGKNGKEHADTPTRLLAADRFAKFFKWQDTGIDPVEQDKNNYNQFNFFNVKDGDQKVFHDNLKELIHKTFKK